MNNFFNKEKINKTIKDLTSQTEKITEEVIDKSKAMIDQSSRAMMDALDANKNGVIDIEDIVTCGLKVPGVKISRKDFLTKQLSKNYSQDIIDKVLQTNPKDAGIPAVLIERIAYDVVEEERTFVTGLSAALGFSGGTSIIASVPGDIAQYYGYLLRVSQKLLYLYGFPEIDVRGLDQKTMYVLVLCLGVMYEIEGSTQALDMLACAIARHEEIEKTALSNTSVKDTIARIQQWFIDNISKELVSGAVKKIIPVVGSVLSGASTYKSFKNNMTILDDCLKQTILHNLDYKDIIDATIIATEES